MTLSPSPRHLGVWTLAAVFVLSLAAPDDSHATKRRHAAQRSAKVKSNQGSGETTRERERRLLRECKGRPNAGACEGFAS